MISKCIYIYILKVYFMHYIIHWGKTQMSKKIPSDKMNVTKNAVFFLSRAPTHRSFTFNLQPYTIWSTWFISLKLCVGLPIFESVSLLFLLKNPWTRKTIIETSRTVLLPDFWFLSYNKKFENSILLRELEFPKCDEIKKSKYWVPHFLSIVIFK